MPRLRLFLSLVFFSGYLAIQCILCLRSIASEIRHEYGFGMYTAKSFSDRPYQVVRSDGSRETFEMQRVRRTNELLFRSRDTERVLVYPSASKPEWTPKLVCRAHSGNAVAIEWMDAGIPRRFDCRH